MWMFHSLNHQCTNFHQISRLCLPQQYLELIRFWRISWQRFKYFLVLNFLIEKGEPLNRCYYSCISPDGQKLGLGDYACVCAFVTFLHQPLYLIHLWRYLHQICREWLWLWKHVCKKFCAHLKKTIWQP